MEGRGMDVKSLGGCGKYHGVFGMKAYFVVDID